MKRIFIFWILLAVVSNGWSQIISPSGPTTFCVPGNVTLTVTGGTGITGYQWINGTTDITGQTAASFVATASGSYKVRLSRGAQSDTTIGPITVTANPLPATPAFTLPAQDQCGSVNFNFAIASPQAGVTYTWDFGDGDNANGNNVNHVFNDANSLGNATFTYPVRVTATTAAGCIIQSATQNFRIKQKPHASLSDFTNVPPFTRCASTGSTVNFDLNVDNSSNTYSTNTFYEINWGDSTPSYNNVSFINTAAIPHTYTALGFFTITHRVTGQNGCQNISRYTVYNGSNPGVGLSSAGSTVQQCTPAIDTFFIDTLRTRNNPPGTTYTVSFNDGSPNMVFAHPPPTSFVHTFNSSSCNATGAINPNSFYVRIRAENPCGFLDGGVEPITTVTLPDADFTIAPDSIACVNTVVTFTNTSISGAVVTGSSTCDNTNIINWVISPASGWTINSGTTGNANPTNNPATWGSTNLGITFTSPGTYSVKLIARNNANLGSPCRMDSILKTVCITTAPTPDFTLSTVTGCMPLTVNAANNTLQQNICRVATYRWALTYASAFCGANSSYAFTNGTTDTSANPSIRFDSAGIYTITQNVTNACGTFTSSKTVDVKRPPTAAINIPAYQCGVVTISPTASVTNCGTGTLGYNWTFTDGNPLTNNSATPTVTFTTPGAHPISLSVSNECGSTIANESVTVSVAPNIAATNDQSLCGGLSTTAINFINTVGTPAYEWTNSTPSIGLAASGTGNIAAFTAINTGATAVTATIIVTPVVSANCVGVPDTFTITVNPKPAAPVITSPVTYCLNEAAAALTATANTGNTLTWYNNAALTGGTATAPTPVTSAQGTTSYYVTQSNGANCRSDAAQIDVTVNPGITGNTISANQSICAGTAPNPLTGNTVTGGSGIYIYQWQSSLTGTYPWTNISGETGTAFAPPVLNDTIWYRRVVTSAPCNDTSNIVRIIVQDALSNFGIGTNQTICEDEIPAQLTGQLPVGGGGSYNYQWYSSTNNFTWNSIAGATLQNYQPGALSVTTYFKRELDAANCDATSNIVTVTVNPKPVAVITPSPSAICVYDAGNISFTATNGTAPFNIRLVVTKPGGATDTVNQTINNNGPVSIQVVPQESATGNYSIRLSEISDNNGCIRNNGTAAVNITVKPRPVFTLSASPSSVCNGNPSTLTASGADTYTWSPGATLSSTTGSSVTAAPATTTTYTVSGTLNGCEEDSTITVTVIQGAVTAQAGADQLLCDTNATTLAGNAPSANATGLWTTVSGPAAAITNASLNNSTVTGLQPGRSYVFRWTITGLAPCPPTSSDVTINVFSPVINTIGNDTIICSGQIASLVTLALSGGSTDQLPALYNFKWESSPQGLNNWTVIPGETNERLSQSPVANTCYRRIVTTNTLCETVSNEICVTVNPAITSNIISATQELCVNLAPSIINGTSPNGGDGIYVYSWETSTDSLSWSVIANTQNYQPPTYPSAGVHYFLRKVTSGNCTNTSNVVKVTVHPDSRAIFAASQTEACAAFDLNTVISVTHLPDSNGTYSWYADNGFIGSTTIGTFAGYTMSIPGDTVDIKLVTASPFGCKPDSMQIQFVTIRTAVATFTKDTAGGCGPLTVAFTNNSNIINPTIQFSWDFGNGITSTDAQPQPVTFVQSPEYRDTVYQVTLKAYNGCDTTIWRDSIKIRTNPKARFALDTTAGCSPFHIVVTNTSLGEPNTYYWDFGNGHKDTTFANGSFNYTYNIGNEVDTFPIRLVAANECFSDTQTINVRVAPNIIRPQVTVSASELFGCTPHIVSFINATTGATQFTWDYGDGSPADVTNNVQTIVTHTFNTPGTFTVTIRMTNGCSDTTVLRQVTVYAKPRAVFTSNPQYCAGDTIRVNNTSTDANNYRWFWGDGQSTNGFEPTHVYTTAGSYDILLRAERTNSSGLVCMDTFVQSITVLIKPDVRVQSNIINPLCVPFTLNATAPGIINETVTWYISDTTVSSSPIIQTGINAGYTFNKPGTFTVKMLASNAIGCSDSTTITFVVRGVPVASFAPNAIAVCSNDTTISYQNSSTFNDFGPLTYRWLVDNTLQGTNGNFTYRYTTPAATLPRIFTTQLIAVNSVGCSDTATGTLQMNPDAVAQFTILNGGDCPPFNLAISNVSQFATTYQWYLNGIPQDTAAIPSILIPGALTNYTVTLVSDNFFGCRPDTFVQRSTSRTAPDAAFTVNDTIGCSGNLNIITTNNTIRANSYIWDWGDATAQTSFISPTHLYSIQGQYVISLVASDGTCRDTAFQTVYVSQKPVVDFSIADSVTCDTARIQFTNLTTGATAYLWTFSDNTTSNLFEPDKSFPPSLSYYTVKLEASNTLGCTDAVIKPNLILAKVPPAGDFVINPSPVISIPQYSFSFENITLDNTDYTYRWDLGDGTFANTRDVAEHQYNDTGRYQVMMIVFDNRNGCPDTTIKTATIQGQPGYLFVPNAFYPNSAQIQFRNFKPIGKGLAEYKFQVFDAWGKLLFETMELDAAGSPVIGWDGTDMKTKKPMPQDAYAWRITAKFRNGKQWDGMSYTNNREGSPGNTFGTVTLFR